MIRQIRLSGRIFLVLAVAVLLPLSVLVIASYITVQTLTVNNLEAFLEESGQGRQEQIYNDFQTLLGELNTFVSDNQAILVTVISSRIGPSGVAVSDDDEIRQRENEIRNRIQNNLINSDYFNSVSLLVYNAPFAAASLQGQIPPSFPEVDGVRSPEYVELEALKVNMAANSQEQGLLVVNINGNWRLMVLTTVYDLDIETNKPIALGYVLADLNLNEVIMENLRSANAYDTYAYLLLTEPLTSIVATNPDLVDLESDGVERAVGAEFGTARYLVGDEGNQRSVIGYSASLTPILGRQFGLVIETDEATISNTIFDAGINRIFPITIGAMLISLLLYFFLRNQIVPPTKRLREAMLAMIGGDFEHPIKDTNRSDELGLLATSFVDLRENVRELTEDMNRRLRERTRDVQVTQDIGRAVTAERDLERLMARVVNLIVQNFPSIYHAQIFLLDEDKQYAVLRASTGQAGRELLSRGHKLGVGSVSVLGQVTEQGQVIIARDTAESSVHRQNEFLGETRAELAIPLRLGNAIIGALDVQSKLRDSFDEDQVAALQTLADQITIAIENARLYAESARLLASIEQERGASTRKAWLEYMNQERKASLLIQAGVKTDYEFEKLSQAVLLSGKALVGDATSRNTIPFAVPIVLRGQTLGVVEYEVPQVEFNYDKVLLAEELVARLAISMENARLFQSSQQSAERERIVNSISTKLTGQTDIEDILQTAIREVGQALRTPQVAIRLTTGTNGHEKETESPSP